MQVGPFIIDWNTLKSFATGREFHEWLGEHERLPETVQAFELYSDGASFYFEIGNALAEAVTKAKSSPLIEALAGTICADDSLQIMDYPFDWESCYQTAMAPETVNRIHQILEAADPAEWGQLYNLLKDSEEDMQELVNYIESVREMLSEATSQKRGIIIHIG